MAAARSSVAAVAAEGLFYLGVAALWLMVIQWDMLDRLLGGRGINLMLPCYIFTGFCI